MKNFVELTRTDNVNIVVNIDSIQWISSYSSGTYISFNQGDASVMVLNSYEELRSILLGNRADCIKPSSRKVGR